MLREPRLSLSVTRANVRSILISARVLSPCLLSGVIGRLCPAALAVGACRGYRGSADARASRTRARRARWAWDGETRDVARYMVRYANDINIRGPRPRAGVPSVSSLNQARRGNLRSPGTPVYTPAASPWVALCFSRVCSWGANRYSTRGKKTHGRSRDTRTGTVPVLNSPLAIEHGSEEDDCE